MSTPPTLVGAGAARLAAGEQRIIVTGAGGWLGLATLELLNGLLRERFAERVVCFGSRARTLDLRDGVTVDQAPIQALATLAPAPSLLLHLAFITQGPAMTLDAAGYVAANRSLASGVLRALGPIGVEGVFLASSGAVHLADPGAGPQSKGLYGWLKRQDERDFEAWAKDTGGRLAIGRVFNLSGPYINRRSTYALATFVADALAGRPVQVQASAPVWRSYTAISTLMGVAVGLLTDRLGGVVVFETGGRTALEMGELALAVAAELGAPGVERPHFDPAAPGDCYVGDGEAYLALARAFDVPAPGLADQIRETADYLDAYPEVARSS